jgi:hypothetical protein
MRPFVLVFLAAVAMTCAFGCREAPTAPGIGLMPPPAQSTGLSGTWTGTGSDNQGEETVSLTMTQAGANVSGTVVTRAVNPADGSCGSCHKDKIGTFTGTISGTDLSLNLTFPSGSDAAPTPICSVAMTIAASISSKDRITGAYTGADSCEGPFTGGTVSIARPPMSSADTRSRSESR